MISIESVMKTALLSVKDTDSLAVADDTMRAAGIRHLPVSDAVNHVVGVISTKDLAGARKRGKPRRVGDVMSREVKTLHPDDPAHEAAALMLEQKFGCVPVVDETETLVGIVTETDFLQVAYQALRSGEH